LSIEDKLIKRPDAPAAFNHSKGIVMDYEAAQNLADQIEQEVKSNPDFWTQETYWNKCRTIVEMRHPKMDVMKQARLVGKMMQEKFPS
jgi:hypothetical protein|tara:strand:+ start:528 stop:791 length:264 start_codon:yes stop_codon:yes gene_type:complete